MKKHIFSFTLALTFLFEGLLVARAQAADPQTFGVTNEGDTFKLSFTYPPPLLPIKLLNNGVDFRDFTLSTVTVLSTNLSGKLVAQMTITPIVRGVYNFQAVAIDPVLGRSDPSNVCTITNRHVPPGLLKKD